jgi:hypothetical protein
MKVQRIWNKSSSKSITPWIIWDNGNTFWELKENIINHYQLISREQVNSNKVIETCLLLDESSVPFHILSKRDMNNSYWTLEEISVIESKEKTIPVQEEEDISYTYTPELWSCVSQWIPQNALFQPSLQHLIQMEEQDSNEPLKKEKGGYGSNFKGQSYGKNYPKKINMSSNR